MMFCLKCGFKMTLLIPETDTRQRFVCSQCKYIHYDNPKVIVGILPVIDDDILLCKRAIDPEKGKWTIPAGFLECGETLLEGAKREAREEAGIDVSDTMLYATFSIPRISQIYVIYLGNLANRHYCVGVETEAIQFFSHQDIPFNDIAFSSINGLLKHYVHDAKTKTFLFRDITL